MNDNLMKRRLTWKAPNGDWGIRGVDLAALPPAAYGALCKLLRMEELTERLADPATPDWERQDLLSELLGQAADPAPGPVRAWLLTRFTRTR